MAGRVAITCLQMQTELDRHRDRLERAGYELVVPTLTGQRFETDELATVAAGCVGLIAGDDDLGRESLERLPELRVLVRWGIGTDSVDFDAAAQRGIVVRNTPGVFGEEVADSAFGYILNLARGHHVDRSRLCTGGNGRSSKESPCTARRWVVGRWLDRKCCHAPGNGFGMRVLAYDPFLTQAETEALPADVEQVELPRLLAESRFVVLTAPATPDTRGMINASTLAQMRPDAYLVNVARGDLVVEGELIAALQSGRLAGAGLDVFQVEPLPATVGLYRLERRTRFS